MKRKVVQHGPSTLIISLPSKWIKRHNIHKGDELEVDDVNNKIVVSFQKTDQSEKIELNISPFGNMIPRTIHALYKRGVDELKLNYDDPGTFNLIQNAMGKEAVGFEVLETGRNYCIIKNVSEGTKEFNQVMRQTLILLLSMAEEGHEALKQGNANTLKNLISLEKTNNRFTTFCRRYLNINGLENYDKVGPLYFIVEHIENIADEYKYLYKYLTESEEKIDINKELINHFFEVNQLLRRFYNLFYKFNPKLVSEFKDERDRLIESLHSIVPKLKKANDIVMFHHLLALTGEIFDLIGPYLVLAFRENAHTSE